MLKFGEAGWSHVVFRHCSWNCRDSGLMKQRAPLRLPDHWTQLRLWKCRHLIAAQWIKLFCVHIWHFQLRPSVQLYLCMCVCVHACNQQQFAVYMYFLSKNCMQISLHASKWILNRRRIICHLGDSPVNNDDFISSRDGRLLWRLEVI